MPAGDDGPFADTVTLEQKTSSIGGTSGKVSLWMQWMLPKVTVKLFAPDPTAKKTGTPTLISQLLLFFFLNTVNVNAFSFLHSSLMIHGTVQTYVDQVNDKVSVQYVHGSSDRSME